MTNNYIVYKLETVEGGDYSNPEYRKASYRAYHATNRERRNAQSKAYHEAHRDEQNAKKRAKRAAAKQNRT